ncbi:MAG: MauE/DoxX family redox-associated membrane protein [Spirochaetia bacterium]|jgi:uncharacterized membrane protein YphA (DoxX/SURF4 family)
MPRAPEGLPWLGLAIRIGAAAVWIVAGAAKLPDMDGFRTLVERYGILPHVLAAPFAFLLPFVEIALGLYLAVGLFVRGTAAAGTALFAVFLAAQATAWARGLNLDCGCFGAAVQTKVGPLTMLRDLGLGVPTFLMLALPARRFSLDKRLFGARDAFDGGATRVETS